MSMTPDTSTALLNLVAASTAVVVLGWALGRLANRYPDGEYRFVFRAAFTWWLSWLSWVVLWVVIATGSNVPVLLTIISDINTILVILTYFALTRGRECTLSQMAFLAIEIAVIACCIDGAFVAFSIAGKSPGALADLQARWSLALAVIGPLLFGWACSLRFGTAWVLTVGVLYAAFQPVAYHVVFGSLGTRPEWRIAVLTVLALLKTTYATVGLLCFGMRPNSAENLVSPPPGRLDWDLWSPAPAVVLAVFGCGGIWMTARLTGLALADTLVGYIVAIVGLLGAVLTVVDVAGRHARKRIDDNYVKISVVPKSGERNKTSH